MPLPAGYSQITLDNPPPGHIQALSDGLRAHGLPITQQAGFQPIGVFIHDAGGKLAGGASGLVNWTWLYIALVWIDEPLRRSGHGRALLQAMEDAGRARGCKHAHLDTFSYQARPFYEKLGYRLFGTLEDYPPGGARYFMRKDL